VGKCHPTLGLQKPEFRENVSRPWGRKKNQPPIGTRWRDPSTRPLRSARRKSCGTAALAQWHAIPFLPRPRPSRLSVQLCSLAPHAHVIPRPLRLTSSLPVPRPLAMADAYWRYAAAAPRQQQQQQQPPPSAGGGVAHPGMGVGAPQMAPAGGQQQPMKRPRPTEFSGPPAPSPPALDLRCCSRLLPTRCPLDLSVAAGA
jgi:hypothetical protein